MQEPPPDVLVHVADNLRRLRHEAGLSQSALAAEAGLSRRTIINLEAGEANIGLSGLDKLARTLGATLVEVVSPPSAPPGRIEATAWRGAEADSRAVLLGSAPARDQAQLWTWSLAAGDRYDAEPDPAGWHEMVFVTAGRLRIEREDEVAVVDAGDYAIYSSAQRYSYVNDAAGTTTFLRNVVS
ncbi:MULTISPECIES: XRE family transcriptional regulator [unclassified Saccharopolyspora]|uniref:XRE family transcriptional regulator n=1 Tax=unclassified Saccharopolyspora TaxID=2646250 RepID=UPI001CD2592D|nr:MULTISPECIES: XRE family transcriptional regulator [unclassified Saccharopolyspora]MCA1184858.1 XRE family transcriptional regulator [Saccharopolyspora sp. 6T]MCA1190583.1 XRE family transcriptional regulator [Saccharopolyspora sp. 6V]MCA1226453.1 XRE family transcriptional regulator [Saccharopolyspora sp. 6M]MCA1283596.1 XRE family transcriptional regulator [Saccharopolyspora sp. 7B]